MHELVLFKTETFHLKQRAIRNEQQFKLKRTLPRLCAPSSNQILDLDDHFISSSRLHQINALVSQSNLEQTLQLYSRIIANKSLLQTIFSSKIASQAFSSYVLLLFRFPPQQTQPLLCQVVSSEFISPQLLILVFDQIQLEFACNEFHQAAVMSQLLNERNLSVHGRYLYKQIVRVCPNMLDHLKKECNFKLLLVVAKLLVYDDTNLVGPQLISALTNQLNYAPCQKLALELLGSIELAGIMPIQEVLLLLREKQVNQYALKCLYSWARHPLLRIDLLQEQAEVEIMRMLQEKHPETTLQKAGVLLGVLKP